MQLVEQYLVEVFDVNLIVYPTETNIWLTVDIFCICLLCFTFMFKVELIKLLKKM